VVEIIASCRDKSNAMDDGQRRHREGDGLAFKIIRRGDFGKTKGSVHFVFERGVITVLELACYVFLKKSSISIS
jgi:hypothetical protein